MVLAELGMFRIHLMAVKIMAIADPAVSAKIYRLRIGGRRFIFSSIQPLFPQVIHTEILLIFCGESRSRQQKKPDDKNPMMANEHSFAYGR
jgi:hypothetical protein